MAKRTSKTGTRPVDFKRFGVQGPQKTEGTRYLHFEKHDEFAFCPFFPLIFSSQSIDNWRRAWHCKERCPHADSNNRVRAGRIFFLTLFPKNLSLYEIYSAPTLVFSKFRVVVPLKNIQRHWGCNQRKVWSKTHCLTDLGPGTLSHC